MSEDTSQHPGQAPASPDLERRRAQRHEARTGQTYHAFLKVLAGFGKLDLAQAEQAATSVLCLLERRIMAEEAHDLEAQLPRKLVALVQRCSAHSQDKTLHLHREQFVREIARELSLSELEAEARIRAVFLALRAQVSPGEIDQVEGQLPRDMRDLWQATV